MPETTIAPAQAADAPALLALLERCGLPTAGFVDHMDNVLVARDGDNIAGVAALEVYDDGVLLRSVAVESRARGAGLGERLTTAALSRAAGLGAPAAYLLTTTAGGFFPMFGFERIDRGQVPPGVRTSVEFTSACPASAVVMRKVLRPTVLFACVHNAGRSQMAAALFNLDADATKARAISAGTHPAAHVHPEVVTAMRELGVDLSAAQPQRLTPELASRVQSLITMGCGDECPVVPGTRRDDWPLEDPKGKPVERVREIRDDVRRRVAALLSQEGWLRAAHTPAPGARSSSEASTDSR